MTVQLGAKFEAGDVEDLSVRVKSGSGRGVGAKDHIIGIKRLRETNGAGARRLEAIRQTEVIEGVDEIGAADRQKSRGGEPSVKYLGKGLTDPVKACLAGVVFKREHEHEASVRDGLGG